MTKNYIIVGNYEAREQLRKNILNCKPTLLTGPNGVGKSSSVVEIAEFNGLNLRTVYPLDQEEIVREFGIGPAESSSKDFYVIEADGLNAKKYSILKNYIKNAQRPLVIISQRKETLNKRIVKLLDVIEFSYPSTEDVEKLLRDHFGWDGNIEDIYDPDMRVVMARINAGEKIFKPPKEKTISAKELAVELGYGYVKKKDFEQLDQPLWWVIRWLGYNQKLKFPKSPVTMLKNLEKISIIDNMCYKNSDKTKDFYGNEKYLHYMLMGVRGSPRRAFFKFPIWPKKENEIEGFDVLSKAPDKPVREKFTLSKWL